MEFSEKLLKDIGNTTLSFILDNIREGVDTSGAAYSYSEKNYYRPFDKKIYSAYKKDTSFGQIITSKSTGKQGFIIFGYKKFKEKFNPQASKNYLTWSGKMLRDMNVLKTSGNEIIIGFNDPLQTQKAYWFNISGVGRSRKLWKFLGLRKEQINMLAEKFAGQITKEIANELARRITSSSTQRQ